MSVSAKQREQSATVTVGSKKKFPIFSQHSAKSAVALENHAKPPLTASQKAAVERKAAKYGVHKEKKNG